jgi:hypothetical protein
VRREYHFVDAPPLPWGGVALALLALEKLRV